LRQRRVRPAPSSARGPHPQHDEQQLEAGSSRRVEVVRRSGRQPAGGWIDGVRLDAIYADRPAR
jgi:hypothetical protein